MLYPQNGDSFVTIDSVTSLYPVYTAFSYLRNLVACQPVTVTVTVREVMSARSYRNLSRRWAFALLKCSAFSMLWSTLLLCVMSSVREPYITIFWHFKKRVFTFQQLACKKNVSKFFTSLFQIRSQLLQLICYLLLVSVFIATVNHYQRADVPLKAGHIF